MDEEWLPLQDFPGYDISNYGQVWNADKDRVLKWSYVQYGIPTVGLMLDDKQYRRSVPVLVAQTWLFDPPRKDFNTVIHLDGDRSNCYHQNLRWRPRWFAVTFHKERIMSRFPNWNSDVAQIELIQTGEVYRNPKHVAETHGVLEEDVYKSIINGSAVFPDWLRFRYIRDRP